MACKPHLWKQGTHGWQTQGVVGRSYRQEFIFSASRCNCYTTTLCFWEDFAATRLLSCESCRFSLSDEGMAVRLYSQNELQRKMIIAARNATRASHWETSQCMEEWTKPDCSWDCSPSKKCHGEGISNEAQSILKTICNNQQVCSTGRNSQNSAAQ